MESEYDTKVHENTARRWLLQLGFSRTHHPKGVYFDGHDREDVVAYRQAFLTKMNDLDLKSLTCYGNTPDVAPGEKQESI